MWLDQAVFPGIMAPKSGAVCCLGTRLGQLAGDRRGLIVGISGGLGLGGPLRIRSLLREPEVGLSSVPFNGSP